MKFGKNLELESLPTFPTYSKMLKYYHGLDMKDYRWKDPDYIPPALGMAINAIMQKYRKADAEITTADTGWTDIMYGRIVQYQINHEIVPFNLPNKVPMKNTGIRALYGTLPTGLGIPESGLLGDRREPSTTKFSHNIKIHAIPSFATVQAMLSAGYNESALTEDNVRAWMTVVLEHDLAASLMGDPDTLAGDNIESIYRATGSKAELDAQSYDAGDLDYLGLDRDAASWADGVCTHNSGNAQALRPNLIDQTLDAIADNCGEDPSNGDYIMLTGRTTRSKLIDLLRSMKMLSDKVTVDFTVNGVKTGRGIDGGFDIVAWQNIPIFVSKHYHAESGMAPQILILNKKHMEIRTAFPATYWELDNPLATSRFGKEMLLAWAGEFIINRPGAHGKIVNIAA